MLVRDDALLELPEKSAAFIGKLAETQALHGELLVRLAAAVSADTALTPKVCPGCDKPVLPNPDGSLPVHEINGLVVGRQPRRTAVCLYKPEAVAK